MEKLCKVTYISNAGIMLEGNGGKILIDSFCNSTVPIYKSPSDETKKLMISGAKPFENIDALLFTHNHPDHFDAGSAAEFLQYNNDAFVIGPQKVLVEIERRISGMEGSRLIKPDEAFGRVEDICINGVNIQSISMLHDGKNYKEVSNLAYLADIGGKKILHVGDAKPARENYINLNLVHKSIDLLIVPFPYIGLPTARQIIESYIKPKKIAVVHMPYRDLDSEGWIDATMKSYLKVKDDFVETMLFENPGDNVSI